MSIALPPSGERRLALFAALAAPALAWAQPEGVPAGISLGSMLQMALSLIVVLGVLGGAAWLLGRVAHRPSGGRGALHVVGGAAVGQRERVVLVEISGTWLVLGVAPGSVRALHTMPKGELSAPAPGRPAVDGGFAARLRQALSGNPHA